MNRTSAPFCSVAICTRNRPELLERCLSSLLQMAYPAFEILVVDNDPANDRSMQISRNMGVRYVVEPRTGLSHARNCALANSTSEIVAFVDDDATCDPNWLSNLVRGFEDRAVAAVTGRILPLRVETEAERLCASMRWLDLGDEPIVLNADQPDWFEAINSRGIGFGGNMALRLSAFAAGHSFDPRLGRGSAIGSGEENYLFLQLLSRGYALHYEPAAVVFHPYPADMEQLRAMMLRSYAATTAFYTMLLAERAYRRCVLRHFWRKLAGGTDNRAFAPINGHLRIALARCWGLMAYMNTLRCSPVSHGEFS